MWSDWGQNVSHEGMQRNKTPQHNHGPYPPLSRLPPASGVAYCTPLTPVRLQRVFRWNHPEAATNYSHIRGWI